LQSMCSEDLLSRTERADSPDLKAGGRRMSRRLPGRPRAEALAVPFVGDGTRWNSARLRAPNPKVWSLRSLWIPIRVSRGITAGMSRRALWRVPYAESSSCVFAAVEARTVRRIYYPRHQSALVRVLLRPGLIRASKRSIGSSTGWIRWNGLAVTSG
jgi:hypothetical protein